MPYATFDDDLVMSPHLSSREIELSIYTGRAYVFIMSLETEGSVRQLFVVGPIGLESFLHTCNTVICMFWRHAYY